MRGISNFDYDTTQSIINHDVRCYDSPPIYYDSIEFNKISVCINNAYKRFLDNCPPRYKNFTFDDYARLHSSIWRLFSSTVLKLHLQNDDLFVYEKYDNLEFVKYKLEHGESISPGLTLDDIKEVDPNKYPHTIMRTRQFAQSYHDNIKHRSVSNSIIMQSNEEW